MKMKRGLWLVSLLILITATAFTFQAAVGGDWEFKMQTRRGEITSSLHIEQDGEKITVTMTNPRGEVTGEGKIIGNEIEWTISRSTPRGEFTMTYKGTVEGNTMKGTVEIGSRGSIEWTATKKG
ncbi:MAG: hypothetical protein B5M54_01835 [Candidatus Aminicenantes bacterium 4484_214]|nr:MAG: hypothetical protein B5M54_01835 [Candidatus Aminicenantes bacterium 4484_214]RLE10925.1 MAG: hypothetical protein DRJ06_00380 [Candidatus Aminicenantes bacterium]